MDGIDFSKAMSKEREKYYKNLQDTRDSFEKDIDKLNDKHKTIEKKQAETFRNQKLDIENATETELSTSKEKMQEALRDRSEVFKNKFRTEQENFALEKERNKGDFSNRLDSLKDTYQKAFKEAENRHEVLQDISKDKYEKNRVAQENRHDRELQFSNQEGRIASEKSQLKQKQEKKDLIYKHQDEVEGLTRAETKKRLDQANDFREQLDELDKVRKSETENLSKHYASGLKLQQDRSDMKYKSQQSNFEKLDQQMREKDIKDKAFISKNHKNELRMIDMNNNKEKEALELKLNRVSGDRGADELNKIILEANDQKNEAKIRDVHNQMADFKEKLEMNEEFNRLKAQSDYKEQGSEYAMKLSQNEKEFAELLNERQSAARNNFNQNLERFQRNEISYKHEGEKELRRVEETDKKHVRALRNDFITTINRIKEDNQNLMAKLHEEFGKDQTAYMEKSRKQNNDVLSDVRAGMNNKLETTMEMYEGRIKNNIEKTQQIIGEYENRIAKLEEDAESKINYQKELSDKREEEYRNVMKARLLTKDAENKKNLEIIRDEQKKVLQKSIHENNTKLAQMTKYYEDKLAKLETDLNREMVKQTSEIKREQERSKIDNELKVHSIVQRYEAVIDRLKDEIEDKKLEKTVNKLA